MSDQQPPGQDPVAYVHALLADLGADAVAGRINELDFELANPSTAGHSLMSMLAHGSPYRAIHNEEKPEGIYVSVKLPVSLMADLLLDSGDSNDMDADALGPFRWSGTSEEWVLKQLSGPLLHLLRRQNKRRFVSLTDELLRIGPLSPELEKGAVEVVTIISAVRDHFDR